MKSATLVLLLTSLTLSAQSQIINQIGNTVKKSTETNATDFNRSRSNKEHNLTSPTPPPPAGGANETVIDSSDINNPKEVDSTSGSRLIDEYFFTSKIVYKIFSFSENELVDTKFLNYNLSDSAFVMKAEQSLMINDYKKNKMLMLDNESKVGVATGLLSPEIMKLTLSTGLMEMNYVKTGKTKVIATYSCSEYNYKDPSGKQVSVWLTKEKPFKDLSELAQMNIDLFMMNFGVISPEKGSTTLGIDQLNENGQIESSILFESFSSEEYKVNLGEYEITTY